MRFQIGVVALAIVLSFCFVASTTIDAQGFRKVSTRSRKVAPVTSPNFVVYAPDPVLANKVSREAERFRKELAIEWLGKELPNWRQKCPINVELGPHAGGETSFAFVMNASGRGEPIDWQMKVYGPHDRVLDAVLPHEVTHTIFATHFGRPLPRWADEGACTTVEHVSERKKNHAMLMDFLHSQPSRGLPFNRMFTMRNYPHDILPLYAQGYSVAKFLILQKGKRYFLDYIGKGLKNESNGPALPAWNQATTEFYDYKDLSDLQIAWLDWVRKGSSETAFNNRAKGSRSQLARTEAPRPGQAQQVSVKSSAPSKWRETPVASTTKTFASDPSGSWYAQQAQSNNTDRIAANRQDVAPTKTRKVSGPERSSRAGIVIDSSLPLEFRPQSNTIWR